MAFSLQVQSKNLISNHLKELGKALERSMFEQIKRLRNKFLNTKSDIGRKAYNKERNLCVSLIRSKKMNFFSNINTSNITDSKTFWKTVKPFLLIKLKQNLK